MRARIFFVLSAVCLAAACGSGDPGELAPPTGAIIERLDASGGPAIVLRPKGQGPVKLVLLVHGAGGSEDVVLTDRLLRPVVQGLVDLGWTVAAARARGDAWGSPQSVDDYARLVTGLHPTRTAILAGSMGGVAGLALIDKIKVDSWVGIYPACDVRAEYTLRGTGRAFRDDINQAYGIEDSSQIPADRTPISPRKLKGLPMLWLASPQDTLVPKALNTDVCATQAQAHGALVALLPAKGQHGDPSHFPKDAILKVLTG